MHMNRSLFTLLFIAFSPLLLQAQFGSKLLNKVKNKVDQRIDQKTDKAIDKTLDKAEGKEQHAATAPAAPGIETDSDNTTPAT